MRDMECTDRRQSPRLVAEGTVVITCLTGGADSGRSTASAARIVERSAYGLRVEIAEAIAPGTLVRLDLSDSLLLGEVAWCAKVGDGYHAGLQMEQSLQHLGDLRRLIAAMLGSETEKRSNQAETVEAGHD